MTSLEDVGEALQIKFPPMEFETLNGYLTSLLGHIPTEKDRNKELLANGYRFKILSLGKRTIDKVKAEKVKETAETDKQEAKQTKGEERACQDIQNSQT